MSQIKLLHVVGNSEFGGIAPYIASLCKMAIQNGIDPHVMVNSPRVVEYFENLGIKVIQISGVDREINLFRDFEGLLKLTKYLRNQKYEIVHTHTSKGGSVGRAAAWLAKVPVVIHTTQGYAFQDYAKSRFMRFFLHFLERLATNWCDMIIAANESDRELAVRSGIALHNKIVTIKNCIDIESIDKRQNDIRSSFGISPNVNIVGVMARLSEQKGLEYFINALPRIFEVFPDTHVLIVGDGELLQGLNTQVSILDISSKVTFTGFRTDWIEVLRVFDVFVMPSLWEGLPITLLGAMATGKPIVATRIKGIIDVCSESKVAILVEPRDSKGLADGIMEFLGDRIISEEYGAAARANVVKEYSETVMNSRTWSLYSRLLKSKLGGQQGD